MSNEPAAMPGHGREHIECQFRIKMYLLFQQVPWDTEQLNVFDDLHAAGITAVIENGVFIIHANNIKIFCGISLQI